MLKLRSKRTPAAVSGEAFGVGLTVVASDQTLLDQMLSWMPPQWQLNAPGIHPATFRLTHTGGDAYEVDLNGSVLADRRLEDAIDDYERALRNHIAAAAPAEYVFIHAGVVTHEESAIVIPGPSFSGKTTLVRALVDAGAVYFSDEYAVLSTDGLVHPYPKPMSTRTAQHDQPKRHQTPEALGAAVGEQPAPLGMVVCTQYRRSAEWDPQELTPAQAALELVQHSRAPEDRAQLTLATLAKAATGTVALKGPRGDATRTAELLLARLGETAD